MIKCIIVNASSLLSLYICLASTYHHSCHKWDQAFPVFFFVCFLFGLCFFFFFFSPIFPLWYIICNATKGKNRGSLATDCSHCSPSLLLINIQSQWKSGATAAAKKFKPCMTHLLDPALRIKKMCSILILCIHTWLSPHIHSLVFSV